MLKCKSRSRTYADFGFTESLGNENHAIYKRGKQQKIARKIPKIKKEVLEQHLWAKGYFITASEQISTQEIQKYREKNKRLIIITITLRFPSSKRELF